MAKPRKGEGEEKPEKSPEGKGDLLDKVNKSFDEFDWLGTGGGEKRKKGSDGS